MNLSLQIQRYFDMLPAEKVPKTGSDGERYREKQLSYQLPKQDLALSYCKHVESQHNSSFEDFVSNRNEAALDIAYVKDAPSDVNCATCNALVSQGDMAVIAPMFRDQVDESKCISSCDLGVFIQFCSTCSSCRYCGIQNVLPVQPVMSF